MPPLLKMEAPDKAFGGVVARCDARFDGDGADGSCTLRRQRGLRVRRFCQFLCEISRLDAGDNRRNDRRVERDGPAEV